MGKDKKLREYLDFNVYCYSGSKSWLLERYKSIINSNEKQLAIHKNEIIRLQNDFIQAQDRILALERYLKVEYCPAIKSKPSPAKYKKIKEKKK